MSPTWRLGDVEDSSVIFKKPFSLPRSLSLFFSFFYSQLHKRVFARRAQRLIHSDSLLFLPACEA